MVKFNIVSENIWQRVTLNITKPCLPWCMFYLWKLEVRFSLIHDHAPFKFSINLYEF